MLAKHVAALRDARAPNPQGPLHDPERLERKANTAACLRHVERMVRMEGQ